MPLLASAQGGILFPLNWFYLVWSPTVASNRPSREKATECTGSL
jgi:hypothetical protein